MMSDDGVMRLLMIITMVKMMVIQRMKMMVMKMTVMSMMIIKDDDIDVCTISLMVLMTAMNMMINTESNKHDGSHDHDDDIIIPG